jgi:hypothetical protein
MLRLEPIRADALETGHGLEAIEVLKPSNEHQNVRIRRLSPHDPASSI